MIRLKIPQAICLYCGRGARVGLNRPKSLHKTKRSIKINLQRWHGLVLCTRCLRTYRDELKQTIAQPKNASV